VTHRLCLVIATPAYPGYRGSHRSHRPALAPLEQAEILRRARCDLTCPKRSPCSFAPGPRQQNPSTRSFKPLREPVQCVLFVHARRDLPCRALSPRSLAPRPRRHNAFSSLTRAATSPVERLRLAHSRRDLAWRRPSPPFRTPRPGSPTRSGARRPQQRAQPPKPRFLEG